ncbi:MAG: hypothetical protein Q9O62_07905 [Ardenticatenia bacterium]|nr:hypothetical protein [Ardenticatenia bacterium]
MLVVEYISARLSPENVATREDLNEVKSTLRLEIEKVRHELIQEIEAVRSELVTTRAELSGEIEQRQTLASFQSDSTGRVARPDGEHGGRFACSWPKTPQFKVHT